MWLWRKNRTVFVASIISYVSGITLLFAYFLPLMPSGAVVYSTYFTLAHLTFWFRLPRLADPVSWMRKLRDFLRNLRKMS